MKERKRVCLLSNLFFFVQSDLFHVGHAGGSGGGGGSGGDYCSSEVLYKLIMFRTCSTCSSKVH